MIPLSGMRLTSVWHILGVGAIGMRWARKLKLAGESVTLILRDEQRLQDFVAAGSGIRYLSHLGEEFVPFPATSLDDSTLKINNLLLCTKSYSLIGAYEAVCDRLVNSANLVLLCNGYGVQQQLAEKATVHRVWAASTTSGANSATPFHLTLAGDGRTELGPISPLATAAECPLLNLPRHSRSDDIETTLWQKVAVNACINPLTALYQLTNGEILDDSDAVKRMSRVAAEIEELSDYLNKPLFDRPLLNVATEVCLNTAANSSSMLQDRINHRPSEIEWITGAILSLADTAQLALNENRLLLEEIRALEATLLTTS